MEACCGPPSVELIERGQTASILDDPHPPVAKDKRELESWERDLGGDEWNFNETSRREVHGTYFREEQLFTMLKDFRAGGGGFLVLNGYGAGIQYSDPYKAIMEEEEGMVSLRMVLKAIMKL